MLGPGAARAFSLAALAVAILFGVALIGMEVGPHRVGDYFTETDFYGGYSEGARALQRGHLDPARYGVVGPVYDAVLALVGFLVRDLFVAAEVISVAAAVAGLLVWFRLLARRADARLGLLAVLFLATNATYFRYGYSVTTDALALALQGLALLLLLAHARPRAAFWAGIVSAIAFLTRYSAAYLAPAGIAALLWGGTLQTQRARAALWFAAGFAAPVLPWVLYSLAHGGTLAFQLHHNIAYDVFARAKGITWDEYQKVMQPEFRSLRDVIARDPGAVASRELFNLWNHLRLDARALLGWPVAAAAGAGIVLGWLDGTLRKLWPLLLAGALGFLILVPAFYSERYSLALLPIYATLAAAAFASPRLALVVGRAKPVWIKPVLAALPLTLAAWTSARAQVRVVDQLPVEVLDAARTLRAAARAGDRVIARKPHIAFHGGVSPAPFPFTKTLPELAAYARSERARWLFFSWPEAEMRPDYFYLLDTTGVVPGLTPRAVSPGHPAVLYEIGPEFGTVPAWLHSDTLTAMHMARAKLLVNPRDARAAYTLGFIESAFGRYEAALPYLEGALESRPDDINAALLMGQVCLRLKDTKRADDAFHRALGVDPGNVAAHIGLGWSAMLAERPADAARYWRDVIGRTRDAAALENMVALYHAQGDAEAEALARAALSRLGKAQGS